MNIRCNFVIVLSLLLLSLMPTDLMAQQTKEADITFNIVVFENFETLDVFGPVEVFGKIPGATIRYYSSAGGLVSNTDNIAIDTTPLTQWKNTKRDVLFIPGGLGTRGMVHDAEFVKTLAGLAGQSEYILSVCTGSALLAKAGVLDGKNATSNKMAFDWVINNSRAVNWKYQARWVVDGNIFTSSGISAGTDMAFAFVRQVYGNELADDIKNIVEYTPVESSDTDPFAVNAALKEQYK